MNPFEEWGDEDPASHQTQPWAFGELKQEYLRRSRKATQRYAQYIAVNAARARLGVPPLSTLT